MSDRLSHENIIPQQPPKTNHLSSNDNNVYHNLLTQPTQKADDNKLPSSVDPLERMPELILKFEEFEILLSRLCADNSQCPLGRACIIPNPNPDNLPGHCRGECSGDFECVSHYGAGTCFQAGTPGGSDYKGGYCIGKG